MTAAHSGGGGEIRCSLPHHKRKVLRGCILAANHRLISAIAVRPADLAINRTGTGVDIQTWRETAGTAAGNNLTRVAAQRGDNVDPNTCVHGEACRRISDGLVADLKSEIDGRNSWCKDDGVKRPAWIGDGDRRAKDLAADRID